VKTQIIFDTIEGTAKPFTKFAALPAADRLEVSETTKLSFALLSQTDPVLPA